MNSENLKISHMLLYIQYYTSRDEHGPIRPVLTNVTFVPVRGGGNLGCVLRSYTVLV